MNFEKPFIIRAGMRIVLYSLIIFITPKLFVNRSLLMQILGVSLAVILFSFWQYKTITINFGAMLKRFGFSSESSRLTSMINTMEEVFEISKHTNIRYKKTNQSLRLAIEINNLFLQSNDQQTVYDFILEKALQAVGKSKKGSILLLNQSDELEVISLVGFDDSFRSLKIKKENDFLYRLTDGKLDKTVIVDDVVEFNKEIMTNSEFNDFYTAHPKIFQTTLSAPIRVDDNFIGVINLDTHIRGAFTKEDLFIMDLFASQLEVAIRNRNLLDEILYLSRYDHLTGVYNRKYFDEVLENLIKKESPFVYTIIDINNLKKVNDVFGHTEGDKLLKVFCDTVSKNIRTTDYFARLGGDEFAIILSDLSKVEASKIFLRIMRQLENFVIENKIHYFISFSYGVTEFPNEARTSDELYIISDEKMYHMKRNSKSDSEEERG